MSSWHKQGVPPALIILKGAVLIVGKVILWAHILRSPSKAEKARSAIAPWRKYGATDAQQRLKWDTKKNNTKNSKIINIAIWNVFLICKIKLKEILVFMTEHDSFLLINNIFILCAFSD